MMREILFRGKTYDDEWEYGSLHIERGEYTKDGKCTLDYRILGMCGECRYVVPETTGQYTGLTDKNGKRIFEGDIVECWSEGVCARGTVQQRKDGMWIIYPAWQKYIMWGLCPDEHLHTTVEVIGNIHDNPELVEVAEDDMKKAQIPEWISVKDKLPENDSHYLVFASDTCEVVECIYYGDGEWMTKDLENMTDCVTHWMPLPKHPKEGALNGV